MENKGCACCLLFSQCLASGRGERKVCLIQQWMGPQLSSSVRWNSDAYLALSGELESIDIHGLSTRSHKESDTSWVTEYACWKEAWLVGACKGASVAGAGDRVEWGHGTEETGNHTTRCEQGPRHLVQGMEMMTSIKGICCSSVKLPKVLVFWLTFKTENEVGRRTCVCMYLCERKRQMK